MLNIFNKDLIEEARGLQKVADEILGIHKNYNEHKSILNTIFDMLPMLIFWKDKENRVININEYGAQLWGATKEDIIGYGWQNLLAYPGQAKKYFDNDLEVINSGNAKMNILEPLVGDPDRLFLTHKLPLVQKGNIVGIIGFSIEVTKICKEKNNA